MMTYILKTILCSALLILVYYSFLEQEKMHRFNRFYLLFSIAFSFIVPLITIKTRLSGFPVSESVFLTGNSLPDAIMQDKLPRVNDSITFSNLLLGVYLAVTAFLTGRFVKNILMILFKIKSNITIPYFDAKLVVTNGIIVPFSFLRYIFINREDFEKGTIEKEILSHELTHVKQKHSIDILFLELLMIPVWINPVLYFYRKAIQLNHEFLADESVVNTFRDLQNYQLLLLDKVRQTNSLFLSSPFNFLITKKRIIMMSKKASYKAASFRKIALIPIVAAIGFLFSAKTFSQATSATVLQQQQQDKQTESTLNGVSQELLTEYRNMVDEYKYIIDGKPGYRIMNTPALKGRVDSLETIFLQMSKEQQAAQIIIFVPISSIVLKKIIPTGEQLESFKDPKMYGVWIDEKRVNNEVLSNYTNTDFSHVSESILLKNATNYGKHVYQVNLMTNDYYQNYYNETVAKKGNTLTFNLPLLRIINKSDSK
jgi:bla regulator protein blaR1